MAVLAHSHRAAAILNALIRSKPNVLLRISTSIRLRLYAKFINVASNRRADQLKVLVYDGVGVLLCTRRLQADSFEWPRNADSGALSLTHEQLGWLVAGLPWQRLGAHHPQAITVV